MIPFAVIPMTPIAYQRTHFRQCVFANMQGAGEPIFETDVPPGEDMMATLRAEPYGKERFEMELAKDRAGETEVRYHPIMH